jgi:hypothetical protein
MIAGDIDGRRQNQSINPAQAGDRINPLKAIY